MLFILYLLPLKSLLNEFLASYHIYADDITIHLAFDPGTAFANFLKHKKIIASVLKLLASLKLKANSSKTQCTNQRIRLPDRQTLSMGSELRSKIVSQLITITESWIQTNENDDFLINECLPENYIPLSFPR